MKIYFVGSIKGKSKYLNHYKKIVETLKGLGFGVLENTLDPTENYVYSLSDEGKIEQYKNVLKWISSSDLVVAEASYPSLGVGFELSLAMEKGKPAIVLYTEEDAPHFIQGVESDKLSLVKYDLKDLKKTLKDAIGYAKDQMDVRFNFFISPQIVTYLDWIAKKRRIPRSVFLRGLLESEMKKDKGYQKESR